VGTPQYIHLTTNKYLFILSGKLVIITRISSCTAVIMSPLLLILCGILTVVRSLHDWSYSGPYGPTEWHIDHADCGGDRQSPIDIDTGLITYSPKLTEINIDSYSQTEGVELSLVNVAGHTAEVEYKGKDILISGGGLPADYALKQFHFHWGKVDSRGSEHAIDGHHYPMEMHIVHKRKGGGNFLAVIGYFFDIGSNNMAFDVLVNQLHNIKNSGANVTIPTFKLTDLLPNTKLNNYFRYEGSLTTPPCSEVVIWTLSSDHITISEDQLNKFRALRDADGKELVDDYRPLQKLNSRKVMTSRRTKDQSGTSLAAKTSINAQWMLTFVACIIIAYRSCDQ